jgi:hypothetical protein
MRRCFPLLTFLLLTPPLVADEPQRVPFTVAETAGIRRFGYPVTAIVPLAAPLKEMPPCRLHSGGKPVTAQIRPHGDTSKGVAAVRLDFTADHGPNESRDYVLEYGNGVEPTPAPKSQMKVEETDTEFRVQHDGGLTFVVPRNLAGLLTQVKSGKTEYLRDGSSGLAIRSGDDLHKVGGKTTAKIVHPGPTTVVLRFERTETLGKDRSVRSVVEMEFPRSKSWVRIAWEVDDPKADVTGLGADLNLAVAGEPTLVDFGAGSLVYAALKKGQRASLKAGSLGREKMPWEVLLGPADAMKPFVTAPGGPQGGKAEGWAHVMDRTRCTAVALTGFGDARQASEITIDADGRLQVWQHFAKDGAGSAGVKRMTFWLHFVGMPVAVGAVTSPQAMLTPLRVTVGK